MSLPESPSSRPSETDPTGRQLSDDDWLSWARQAESVYPRGMLGPYEILGLLGRGGQGTVYKARQPGTGRVIAIKVLAGNHLASAAFRARFDREVRTAAALRHPHIVTVFGSDTIQGRPLFLMEFVEGVPLHVWVRGSGDQTQEVKHVLRLFEKLCRAISCAHQRGVIHRDLKPSNVLIDRQGEPRVLDFGLAQVLSPMIPNSASLEVTTSFVGTPAYASPEQLGVLDGQTDTRSDIFSLGCMLYQSLTGRRPTEGNTFAAIMKSIQESEPKRPSVLNTELDGEIDAILQQALAKSKVDRYQSMDAFANDLLAYLENRPIQAHPPTLWYQTRKWIARHRLVFGFSLSLLTLLVAWALSASVLSRREHRARLQADAARADAEWSAYVSSIAGAEAALSALNVTQATEMLDNAPPHLRNWEWYYYQRQCDQSVASIQAPSTVYGLAVSDDGAYLAAGCRGGTVEIYDGQSLTSVVSIAGAVPRVQGLQVAFVPETSNLVYAANDQSLRICQPPDPRSRAVLTGPTGPIRGVTVSHDGRQVAAASEDGAAYLWILPASWPADTDDPVIVDHARSFQGHEGQVMAIAFDRYANRILTAGMDRNLIAWDGSTGQMVAKVPVHEAVIGSIAVAPDESRFVSSAYDGSIKLWNSELRAAGPSFQGHSMGVSAAAFCPVGDGVVSTSWDRTVRLWDASSGKPIRTYLGHQSNVSSLACAPEGTTLYTGDDSATIKVWNTQNSHLLQVPARDGRIQQLAVGPTCDWLVVIYGRSLDGQHMGLITLWDLHGTREAGVLAETPLTPNQALPEENYGLAVSPDGKWLAASLPGTGIYMWSTESLSNLATAANHHETPAPQPGYLNSSAVGPTEVQPASITCLAFSGDSHWLAAGHGSGQVFLWSLENSQSQLLLKAAKGITSLVFNNSNQQLLVADVEGHLLTIDPLHGTQTPDFTLNEGMISSLAYDPTHDRIAIGTSLGMLIVRSATDQHEFWRSQESGAGLSALAFSPDGTRLASASNDRTIHVWDTRTGKRVATLLGHAYLVNAVAFTPDGSKLISGSADKTIRIWDAGRMDSPQKNGSSSVQN